MSARTDAAYQNDYHHKLRGRIWDALEGTLYGERHGDGNMTGFSYSNPFPPSDMKQGDDRKLLIASPNEGLLATIANDLLAYPEFNIGEMPFQVHDVDMLEPDVGEPGMRGKIETGTGMLVRIPPWRCDEYGIDNRGDESVFWRPEHSTGPLESQLEENLDKKHDQFAHDYLPGPSEDDGKLFDGYELIKTFAVPVTVTEGQKMTYVLSKWRFSYTVRDDHHRRHLNLAFDCGLGERNSLGLGFVNPAEAH